MDADGLLRLKERIRKKQEEKSRLQGRLDQLLRQLQEEFGCQTADEGREKLEELEAESLELEKRIAGGIAEIRTKYGQLAE